MECAQGGFDGNGTFSRNVLLPFLFGVMSCLIIGNGYSFIQDLDKLADSVEKGALKSDRS
jgi:hypothetical protein